MWALVGLLFNIATFPGVIVHELAHLAACKLCHVPVREYRLFRLGAVAGYVIHDRPRDHWACILVVVGPFLVNTGVAVALTVATALITLWTGQMWMGKTLYWLAISVAAHALPSTGDAGSLWQDARQRIQNRQWLALLSFPLAALMAGVSMLRVVWADLIYAVLLVEGVGNWYLS